MQSYEMLLLSAEFEFFTSGVMEERAIYYSQNKMRHRVPTWCIQLIGFTSSGWFGWDPLNEQWVAATYGRGFVEYRKLNPALLAIGWDVSITSRRTIDYLKAYSGSKDFGAFSQPVRLAIAELLKSNPVLDHAKQSRK